MAETNIVLQIIDIHTYYGNSHVLQGVSLTVNAGQIVALVGRNGVGKTTFIRSVIGFTPPRRGSILFKGTEIAGRSPCDISRMGVGLVPQGRRVFSSLNVHEHLDLAFRQRGSTPWTLNAIYQLFSPLRARAFVRARALSGGEQQMLATGRSLATNPELFLMDEPTEGLAPNRIYDMGTLLTRLRESGAAIVLVEQNLDFALRHADVIHVLSKGKIVRVATPLQFMGKSGIRPGMQILE